MIESWVRPETTARRLRLKEAIAKMAAAILAGECEPPSAIELQALLQLCHDHFLPAEAARVQRWMTS